MRLHFGGLTDVEIEADKDPGKLVVCLATNPNGPNEGGVWQDHDNNGQGRELKPDRLGVTRIFYLAPFGAPTIEHSKDHQEWHFEIQYSISVSIGDEEEDDESVVNGWQVRDSFLVLSYMQGAWDVELKTYHGSSIGLFLGEKPSALRVVATS